MDAIQKFKEAAKGLQADDRYLALTAAREANDADEALQRLIGDFNTRRIELNNEIELPPDARDDAKVATLNEEVNRLYNDIMQNPCMLAYNEAKQGMERFMSYLNAILNAAIEGEDPFAVEEPDPEACDPSGCASCAGCG